MTSEAKIGDQHTVPHDAVTPPGSTSATDAPVAAVVLNWHGRDDTLRCLASLRAQTTPPRWTILIDNGCRDFDAGEPVPRTPGLHYVHTETNLGFAGGANLGIRHALDLGAQWVWLINNDAEAAPPTLAELLRVAGREPTAAIVGARILLPCSPPRLDSIALHVDRWSGRVRLAGHEDVDGSPYDAWPDPEAVSGCSMLLSRAACETLDGFDESFFAYLEDADLCLRARSLGLRIAVAPAARVVHHRAPAHESRQSVASLYYTTRNHLFLMQRHGRGGPLRASLRSAMIVLWSLAYALRTAGRHPLPRVAAVLRGARDYRRRRMGALP